MPRNGKPESSTIHNGDSSFVSLLSGWVQQGVENFFATQRILVDLAMTQNANAMKMIRSRFADPAFCPAAIATELAGEVITNFIEGQKLLLGLAQREHEIVTTGVKERVAGSGVAVAMTDMAQRSRWAGRDGSRGNGDLRSRTEEIPRCDRRADVQSD
jgi:hypothetical protein